MNDKFIELRELLSKSKIDEGILLAKKLFPTTHKNKIVQISQRYYKWKKENHLGIVPNESVYNRIIYDFLEIINEIENGTPHTNTIKGANSNSYDIALIYSLKDTDYIKEIVKKLTDFGINVYEDRYENENKWGNKFNHHVANVIQKIASYSVFFCSQEFDKNFWKNISSKSKFEDLFSTNKKKVLFSVLDSNEIPYIDNDYDVLDLRLRTIEETSVKIAKRLNVDSYLLPDYPEDTAELIIYRRGNNLKKFDWIYFHVYLDDIHIGKIKVNESFKFKLAPGKYSIEVKYEFWEDEFDGVDAVVEVTYSAFSEKLTFHLSDGENYFECGFKEYNTRMFGLIKTSFDNKLYLKAFK